MKKILVLGSTGLVGSRFIGLLTKSIQPILPESDELDITARWSVMEFFDKNKEEFETVVNFAGFSDVDAAESQRGDKKGDVWQLNVDGAQNVARAATRYGKFLIHISTDFVFPGTEGFPGPYGEDTELPASPDKLSWYTTRFTETFTYL